MGIQLRSGNTATKWEYSYKEYSYFGGIQLQSGNTATKWEYSYKVGITVRRKDIHIQLQNSYTVTTWDNIYKVVIILQNSHTIKKYEHR